MLHRICAVVALCLPIIVQAQVPEDLATKKDYRMFKISSADPTGKNGDARGIGPCETIVLADIKGNGRFTHLWITIAAESRGEALRELVLRMTWDDAATPAVETPV